MTLAIPLQAVPSQTLTVLLGGQSCRVNVYQKRTGMYADLYVTDAPVVLGVACLNDVLLVRDVYRGFLGDLYFHDTQGTADPDYTGLGDRYVLLWTGEQPT